MANINIPQRKSSIETISNLGQIGGGIASLMGGNPMGALGVAGGLKNLSAQPQAQPSAIDRKVNQGQFSTEEKLITFRNAEKALPSLPQEVREEVAPTIFTAMTNLINEMKANATQVPNQRTV